MHPALHYAGGAWLCVGIVGAYLGLRSSHITFLDRTYTHPLARSTIGGAALMLLTPIAVYGLCTHPIASVRAWRAPTSRCQ